MRLILRSMVRAPEKHPQTSVGILEPVVLDASSNGTSLALKVDDVHRVGLTTEAQPTGAALTHRHAAHNRKEAAPVGCN